MRSIDRLLSSLKRDETVHDVRIGTHWTAVATGASEGIRCGLATTCGADESECQARPSVREAGRLIGRSALELARLISSDSVIEASVGLATINALLDVDLTRCVEVSAEEIITERGVGKHVAMVGHFPFVSRVRRAAQTLWVLELRPRADDLPAARAADVIPEADLVAISSSTLLNHTFDGLISLCRPGAYVLMLGGSTPLSPLFFEDGVDAVAGAYVVDVQAVLNAVSQGANFRQIPGKRLLTMYRQP